MRVLEDGEVVGESVYAATVDHAWERYRLGAGMVTVRCVDTLDELRSSTENYHVDDVVRPPESEKRWSTRGPFRPSVSGRSG